MSTLNIFSCVGARPESNLLLLTSISILHFKKSRHYEKTVECVDKPFTTKYLIDLVFGIHAN